MGDLDRDISIHSRQLQHLICSHVDRRIPADSVTPDIVALHADRCHGGLKFGQISTPMDNIKSSNEQIEILWKS